MAIKSRNKVSASFSMSSMTDIVFLLLIFFMLTSTLVTTNAIDILTPRANGMPPTKPSTYVSVDKNSNYYIDNVAVQKELLESRLMQKLGSKENKIIVLRVEKTVPIDDAVYVMDIANQNHVKVVLAAQALK